MKLKPKTNSLFLLALMSLLLVQVIAPVYAPSPVYTTTGRFEIWIQNSKNMKWTLIGDSGPNTPLNFYDMGGPYPVMFGGFSTKKGLYNTILRNYGTVHWTLDCTTEGSIQTGYWYDATHGPKRLRILVGVQSLGGYDKLIFDLTLYS